MNKFKKISSVVVANEILISYLNHPSRPDLSHVVVVL